MTEVLTEVSGVSGVSEVSEVSGVSEVSNRETNKVNKANQKLSRRSFLNCAVALGAVATAGGMLTGCNDDRDNRVWDYETDVIVVGAGFAGLAAAHEAAKAGASVALIDKAPEGKQGGNSRVCLQAIWSPRQSEEAIAIKYFKEITGEYHMKDIDDDIVAAYIKGVGENEAWFLDEFGFRSQRSTSNEYPKAPSATALVQAMIYHAEGLGVSRIWNGIYDVVSKTATIDIQLETALTDLIVSNTGEVIGIEASKSDNIVSMKAKKGVVLCCGGFEFNEVMKSNYNRYPSYSWGTPYNTGDAIIACLKHDIAMWHMNSATAATRLGLNAGFLKDEWEGCSIDFESTGGIWLDKHGARFMDETREAQHGYGRNAIFFNDSSEMEWPRVPFWQVLDSASIRSVGASASVCGWLGIIEGLVAPSMTAELTEKGVLLSANTIESLASQMKLDASVVKNEIEAFNENVALGTSDQFGRKPTRALVPPYYAAQLYPVMVNTNGGPKRNAKAEVLKNDGTPMPRLYSAGELGSIWAWYYQGAGNTSECLAFGRIAGRNVGVLSSWDAK